MTNKYPFAKRVIVFVVLPLVALIASSGVHMRSGLPTKAMTLEDLSLSAPVSITRDKQGVPHILAASDLDAFFAIGFVQAQDRLWQLEVQRRMVDGQLSEVFGPDTVRDDLWFRTLGLRQSAESSWAALSEDSKASLVAYSQGVNAAIERQRSNLPSEFLILGISPKPWTKYDSLGWVKMFALNLGGNFRSELSRYVATKYLNPKQVATFFPDFDGSHSGASGAAAGKGDSRHIAELLLLLADRIESKSLIGGSNVGSNAWVVNGRLGESGGAIVANDPHLALQIPSLWYPVVAKGKKLDVSGMTLVGLPVVIFGKNGDIAWAGTNMMADTQDLYFESTNEKNPSEYEFMGKAMAFSVRTESIEVRSEFPAWMHKKIEPVKIQIRETIHGPVISDIFSGLDKPISLRWTALDADDTSYEAFYLLNYATNWTTFKDAMKKHVAPPLNVLYGDSLGNIGYIAAGRIPVRKSGDGTFPTLGWTGETEWASYVSPEDWITLYNPRKGYIVSANDKIASPYFISKEFANPSRARRIAKLLDEGIARDRPLKIKDMQRIQLDLLDSDAWELSKELVKLVPNSPSQRDALKIVKEWNGEMSKNSSAAAIYEVWMWYFRQRIFNRKLEGFWNRPGEGSFLMRLGESVAAAQLLPIVSGRDDTWCERAIGSMAVACEQELRASLDDALRKLERLERSGNSANWSLGKIQSAWYVHKPFSQISVLDKIFGRHVASGGSRNTINVAVSDFDLGAGFIQHAGAGFRQVIKLDPERSDFEYVISTGQSGNIVSGDYDSMLRSFGDGEYFRLIDYSETDPKTDASTAWLFLGARRIGAPK